MWKRSFFCGSGNAKILPLPHRSGVPKLTQHFDRRGCTPEISYDKKAEENNKNIFAKKHEIIFQQ